MSSLRPSEKSKFEKLFGMEGGYVLNFSDSTFGNFFAEVAEVDIHSPKYHSQGTSKAKKLRAFWTNEPDALVGKVLSQLLEMWHGTSDSNPDGNKLYDECRAIVDRLLAGAKNLGSLKRTAVALDAFHLADQIRRMEEGIERDPALAIGTAKELLETVCKTILAERGKPMEGTPELPNLTKETFKELKLVPEGVPDEAKGAKAIKVLLSNLATIANNLAEIRNLYGTGHGKGGTTKGLSSRHAKLAVGAASTLATFLFETHSSTTLGKE